MSDPNQTDPTNQQPVVSPPPAADTPFVPDFQTTDSTATPPMVPNVPPIEDSALPPVNNTNFSDRSNVPPVVTTGSPKKKFGTGRIVATILGFFILVGGIAGGVILTQQQQDIREKADFLSTEYNNVVDCINAGVPETVCRQQFPQDTLGFVANCINQGVPETVCRQQFNVCVNNCTSQGRGTQATCENQCNNGTINDPDPIGSGPSLPPSGSCSNVFCTGNQGAPGSKCTVGDAKDLAGGSCMVIRYQCRDIKPSGVGCNENGAVVETATIEAEGCGTVQIDVFCERCGFNQTPTEAGFRSIRYAEPCRSSGGGTPPPGGDNPTAQCLNIQAYSETFTALTPTELSQSQVGDQVNFCVRGTASEGNFDKAKFTINGVVQPETTTKRPGTNDFCQAFTIPAGATTFNIDAQIHHVPLGYK